MLAAVLALLQTVSTVIAVAGAATSVAVSTVKVGAKVVSTAVDAVMPSGDARVDETGCRRGSGDTAV